MHSSSGNLSNLINVLYETGLDWVKETIDEDCIAYYIYVNHFKNLHSAAQVMFKSNKFVDQWRRCKAVGKRRATCGSFSYIVFSGL